MVVVSAADLACFMTFPYYLLLFVGLVVCVDSYDAMVGRIVFILFLFKLRYLKLKVTRVIIGGWEN